MKEFVTILCRMIAKLLSVRLWVTILITVTLCQAVLKCFELINVAIQGNDEKLLTFIEKIIMFILGGFMTVVSSITTLYFSRTDRNNHSTEENGDSQNK